MNRNTVRLLAMICFAYPAAAATITIEQIARKGDPVPGQSGASGFTTNLSRPSINSAGTAVFEGLGPSGSGIYVKNPGQPLAVLVDATQVTAGVPTFPVPGQPAGTNFSGFKAPLINDAGNVVFFASYSGGSGIYATTASGGPIVKLADTTDSVPGLTGVTFEQFQFSLDPTVLTASLNNNGDVVIVGRFRRPVDAFDRIGLYATTVAGGTLTRLVDSTEVDTFTPSTLPAHDPALVLDGVSTSAPALTDSGHVVFRGSSRLPAIGGSSSFRSGIFSVPLDGLSPPTIVALKFDTVPTSTGGTTSLNGFFGNFDVNEAGNVVLHANHSTNPDGGIYVGDVTGTPIALVVDNLSGFQVPGRAAGVRFTSFVASNINDSGQVNFFSFDNNVPANNGGLYLTDLSGGAPSLVANTFGMNIPNRGPLSKFGSFTDVAVGLPMNATANMAFGANGDDTVVAIFGLYFYNACAGTIERIADDATAPTDLGGSFFTSGNRGFELHAGFDTRAGHYRSMNDNNQVAFLTRFANFDAGVYIATITGAGGAGGLTIDCPANATVECGSPANPLTTGSATAADSCTGTTVPTTFTDATVPGPGGTETITRTWSADDGAGNITTCDQMISVVDTTLPTLSGVPADTTAECDAVPTVANPTVADTCDAAPSLTFAETLVIGACLDQVTRTRTWTGSDGSGNAVAQSQIVLVDDTTPPTVTCPAGLALSGGFGGANVSFATSAVDNCDPAAGVATNVASGSFFNTGATTVTATAMDRCGNLAGCSFDVLVSCFGINRAKIGTKELACRGIEEIEFTSMNGSEELISLFKAEEGSGGTEEDTLPPSIVVDDGVNGPVTVDTSCGVTIEIGDVFGPYTVTDVESDYDDTPDDHGNDVELSGSFIPAVAFDLAIDDVTYAIDDGMGNVATFTIPAGSFQIDGNPSKGKFKFEGNIGGANVKAKFKDCKFKFKAQGATNTAALTGTSMSVSLIVGPNVGSEVLNMEDKGNHLKFKREPKVNCCPECIGVASMQVTSDQGVLVFVPASGATQIESNTTVDDGVNGSVTIHTSCSQPIEVGDTFGPYTISEVIKIYESDD